MGQDWADWALARRVLSRHLSQLSGAVQQRTAPVWKSALPQFERGVKWLWRKRRSVAMAIVGSVLLYLIVPHGPQIWKAYKADRDSFTPFFTPIGALLVGLAAFGQWRTARLRHEEQTNADRQRRITESFSKAVEQIGNDKLEVRLGGIYSLERISKESPDDYWTVMENLTAFVREKTRRAQLPVIETTLSPVSASVRPRLATDIAAALSVILRRDKKSRQREEKNHWRLNLQEAILSYGDLPRAYLPRAELNWANLTKAFFAGANLQEADLFSAELGGINLTGADLTGAYIASANLTGANLIDANLSKADLREANLTHAQLTRASLSEALLVDTDLNGADFCGAVLFQASLAGANFNNAKLLRANLAGADFALANLSGVNLSGSNLCNAKLGANLIGASFSGADLRGADFRLAEFYIEMDFPGADLTGTDFSGADLAGANFCGVDLVEAKNLTQAQLDLAFGDDETKLPPGMTIPIQAGVKRDGARLPKPSR